MRYESGVGRAERRAALESVGASAETPLPIPNAAVLRLPRGASVKGVAAALERRPEVRYAEPNVLHEVSGIPDDPRFGELWGLHQPSDADIDAPEAWDVETGSSGVTVAVVDTGVSYLHPDLAPNIWTNDDPPGGGDQDGNGKVDDIHGWDFVQKDNAPLDYHGHGTGVAATIGARGNNGIGMSGVSWDVSIMPLRAGDGSGVFTATAIAAALRYACAEGADIVNGSFSAEVMSSLIRDAVLDCPGTLFVFAAGNEGWDLDGPAKNAFPCELHRSPVSAKNVLCVGATDELDGLATFSNHGSESVHLAAPGSAILSAAPTYRTVWGPDGFDDSSQEGFDGRWGDRTSTPGDAQWGRTEAERVSGTHSLTDSPDGSYENNTDATIRKLHPLVLSGEQGCRIDHQMLLDSEWFFDRFDIIAGLTSTPTTLIGSWSGTTEGSFVHRSSDLSLFDGRSSVHVRLRMDTDASETGDGVYVDDLLVKCLEPTGERYDVADSSSLATAHVSGVAALVLARYPTRTPAKLKSSLTSTVDRLPSLTGKVVTGGRVNAATALLPSKLVRLKASRKVVKKGKRVRLIAKVRPCAGHEGEVVRFQRRANGTWKLIGKRSTNDRCTAKLVRRLRRTSVFRVISPRQDEDHLTGVSNRVRVRVRR